MPTVVIDRPVLQFDAIHLDGGHDARLMFADISNAIRLARPGALFVVDDLQSEALYAVFERYVSLGYFLTPANDEFLPTRLHQVVRLAAS
jgi:hypothetical protein